MGLLLHTCCAPCLTYSAKVFKKRYSEITALWYNPNIHPFKEYERRYKALEKYENKTGMDIIYIDEYLLESFLQEAMRSDTRCELCYELRLGKTAEIAEKRDFDNFSTTLTISPYQDHDKIKEVGNRIGERKGIEFIYKDMRDGFSEHHKLANEMDLYKQGYCGCIFSEKERYQKELSE